jgi:MFS family permease
MSSSFFWGYVLTQVPGGSLAQRIGGKTVIFWGVLLSAACSILSPAAARFSPYALIVMRFISGVGQVSDCYFIKRLIGRLHVLHLYRALFAYQSSICAHRRAFYQWCRAGERLYVQIRCSKISKS